jgi:hypothetical protein
MNHRGYGLPRLTTVVASLAISTVALAQSPGAPQDLKLDGDSKSVRLSWTASPGGVNTYLVERSGPGYGFFEQIAGPISAANFTDTTGFVPCKSQDYTYRVRAVDSASNKSPYSVTISTSTIRVVCSLPLVGKNVLDLLGDLPGLRQGVQSDAFSFVLTGVRDRAVTFAYTDGSQSFSWGCPNCSFVVGPDGVSPAAFGYRGIVFSLSADGSQLAATCRAVRCDVSTAGSQRQLGANETATIPASQRSSFTVSTR